MLNSKKHVEKGLISEWKSAPTVIKFDEETGRQLNEQFAFENQKTKLSTLMNDIPRLDQLPFFQYQLNKMEEQVTDQCKRDKIPL